MNELRVFLISEIEEICVGDVSEIINRTADDPRIIIDRFLMDLVGDMIGDGSSSSTITVELRSPTGEQNVI